MDSSPLAVTNISLFKSRDLKEFTFLIKEEVADEKEGI